MSRILDRGPHTVTIFPEESFVDSYGNTVKRPAAVGVVVSGCQLTPQLISRGRFSDLGMRDGQEVQSTVQFRAREAPLGPWARLEWQGHTYVPLSTPIENVIGGVRHVACTLQQEA